jgi:glycerate 2-kinase
MMPSLRDDAAAIRSAAIESVLPARLVAHRVSLDDLAIDGVERLVVVGAGKAAAGMAEGIESLLGADRLARHRATGLVSVPEGCGRMLSRIAIRETRPAAANLPTAAVVQATHEILAAVSSLGPRDLAIALITGGGSALLAAPKEGVSLEEKIALTQELSAAGADIATLNAARREMSLVKGGGLARACTAGRLLVLVLSDVIGNDLEVIASGPCMPSQPSSPAGTWTTPSGCRVQHVIVGDNATAVDAAARAAQLAGYEIVASGIPAEGSAEAIGGRMAAEALALVAAAGRDGRPRAIVSGGEATVKVPADHGTGGRNQQTVLAAIAAVRSSGAAWPEGLLIASVGTDGEDGPTDAAGAFADAGVVAAIEGRGLDVGRALARCDAYPLLEAAGGLVRTGPTGTNVADIRVVLSR